MKVLMQQSLLLFQIALHWILLKELVSLLLMILLMSAVQLERAYTQPIKRGI